MTSDCAAQWADLNAHTDKLVDVSRRREQIAPDHDGSILHAIDLPLLELVFVHLEPRECAATRAELKEHPAEEGKAACVQVDIGLEVRRNQQRAEHTGERLLELEHGPLHVGSVGAELLLEGVLLLKVER
eukprot:CAMPEP_0119426466 /NCGR_PEP_ID=MMETSP1335-20130426/36409_1 /TAXON_ID=259385 /ORGANISM="Chrysoculter rhomboideus, Strain RCC1486" /LENGTH=129 /DNA_ID=CAMNT_0007452061 /DNA_START=197 /DNA_END=583 /DNA_ORIENTATION=+